MGSNGDGVKAMRSLGRISLALCLLVFVIFVANVLLGKARLVFAGVAGAPILSDVVEYVLLMATALFFATAALAKERMSLLEENRDAEET